MKKMFLVVLAFAFVACDKTEKTPLGDSDLSIMKEKNSSDLSLVGKNGKNVTPNDVYSEIRYIAEDGVVFCKNKSTGQESLYDKRGNTIFRNAQTVTKEVSVWKANYKDGTTQIWDKKHNLKTDIYNNIIVGLNQIIVSKDGKCGVLNRKGETILPLEFKEIKVLDDGKDYCYIIFDEKAKLWRRYDSTGKKTKTVYSVKTLEKMQKRAVSSWSGGFKVKKI